MHTKTTLLYIWLQQTTCWLNFICTSIFIVGILYNCCEHKSWQNHVLILRCGELLMGIHTLLQSYMYLHDGIIVCANKW